MPDYEALTDIGEILSNISKDDRDRLIKFNLPHFQSAGYGITQTARIFRQYGYKFSDRVFRDLWQNVQVEQTLQRYVLYHDRDSPLSELELPTYNYEMDEKYYWAGRIQIYDPITGDIRYRSYYIKTNEELMHYEAEEQLRQAFLTDSDPTAVVLDVQLMRGYINEKF